MSELLFFVIVRDDDDDDDLRPPDDDDGAGIVLCGVVEPRNRGGGVRDRPDDNVRDVADALAAAAPAAADDDDDGGGPRRLVTDDDVEAALTLPLSPRLLPLGCSFRISKCSRRLA